MVCLKWAKFMARKDPDLYKQPAMYEDFELDCNK